ncbi:MAG: hypothetical protein JWN57_695 [Frankiales bacterium]|nr:hypothetical protein [Frankiales bacterium]
MTVRDGRPLSLPDRVAQLPPAALGLVVLLLLHANVDRADPGAGGLELPFDLLALAYALSVVVSVLVMGAPPRARLPAGAGVLVRGALLVASVVLVVVALACPRLNPITDWHLVVGLLVYAALAASYQGAGEGRLGQVDRVLGRFAVPVGLLALVLTAPVIAYRLAHLT